MIASFQSSKGRSRMSLPLIGLMICLFCTACAFTQSFTQSKVKDEALVDSPRGTVFLQKADDDWFKTAHPLSVTPAMMASVLRGVQVKVLLAGAAEVGPVFSDEDTEFLSTLISIALSKAAKRQVVGFRVRHSTDTGNETTGGILYVQGRLLHLTFTHYRAYQERSSQASPSPRLVSNPMGLETGQLTFIPETVQRSSRHEQPDVINTPSLASLVIDYEELLTASGLQPTVAQPTLPASGAAASYGTHAPKAEEARAVQEPVRQKETELEVLKEEVRTLQRRLSDLDSDIQRTKQP